MQLPALLALADQQYVAPGEQRRIGALGGIAFAGRIAEHGGKAERAAPALFADNFDFTAHELRQFTADGEPKPRAAEAPRRGNIRLGEFFEQFRHDFGRNADAAIRYLETQCNGVLGKRIDFRFDDHATPIGEFHRVAHEVENDLAQPVGIAPNPRRHIGRDVGAQVDPLAEGPAAQQLVGRFHDTRDVELYDFELQLRRVHFREIENIVDDRHQRVS